LRVPDGHPEHATQTADRAAAPLLVGVHDGFGVARRRKDVAVRVELRSQFAEVIDLPVEHDPDAAVLVAHGLMAGAGIHDAQPPHPERRGVVYPCPFIVGPAVDDDVAHATHERPVGIAVATHAIRRIYKAGDAAHGVYFLMVVLSTYNAGVERPRASPIAR